MTPRWFTRELSLGDEGDDVLIVQRKVAAPMTGEYDGETTARVRGVQKKKGLPQTGEVDAETAAELGEKPDAGQRPDWFDQDLTSGAVGPAVERVRDLLKQPNLPVYYCPDLEAAVRRFQSQEGLEVTGVVDLTTATLLHDRSA